VERDSKVRAAADKVADSLEKITVAEAKRATQTEKSKAVNEAIAKTEADLVKLRGIDHVKAAEEILRLEKSLGDLRQKSVDIDNKLVASSAAVTRANRDKARAVSEAGDAYRKMGNDADDAGKKLDQLKSKLSGIGDGGAGFAKLNLGLTGIGLLPAAATAITEVAGALNQLAGAGFAVPGIFAGIASSVGVGALGMHGMSDAIKAVDKASDGTKSSVEAANTALAALDPTAAGVVKTVVGLKGTFTDLQHLAAGNLFAGVSDDLKGLAAADLPAATRGIDGISKALNQNLRQAITSLGSGSSQGFLDRIFGNTATAQSKLTQAIDPIVHAIGALSATGSDVLPRLADGVGSVADRFDRFISAADASGKLTQWIDGGITGFEQLGNTVINLGKSFENVLGAAGGGQGLIGGLEQASQKLLNFTNSAEGQQKLTAFFAEGRDMLGQLKDVAVAAGPVLAGVFQSGLSAANLWLPVIKDVLTTINKIPGGASAVVAAFVAWESIKGVASLATALGSIANLLKVVLPGAAISGAGGISAALAAIKIPAFLTPLMAFMSAYEVGQDNPIAHATTKPGQEIQGQPNTSGFHLENGRIVANAPAPGATSLPGYSGGGGSFASPQQVTDEVNRRIAASTPQQTVDEVNRRIAASSVAIPGVSGYTDPTITSGGSGAAATPFIDPSKYMMGDPLAGMPAAVAGSDPQKVFEADSALITNTHDLEQKKLALQVLEAKGTATQQELLTAKNDVQEKERSLYDAQAKDLEARNGQIKKAVGDLKDVFAPLDSDFGISKGLPGIVENLVKALGDFALGGAIRSSPTLQAAALSMQGGGSGSGAASGPGYGYGFGGGAGFANPNVNSMIAAAQAGSGGKYAAASDLANGLTDCSGAVSDLYEILKTGQSTPARDFTTANFATPQGAAALGFQPGYMPGAFNVGVKQGGPGGGHMAATLPNGVNFESGGGTGQGATYGGNAAGALSPEFDSRYYIPVGGVPAASAIGPSPIGGGVGPDLYSPANTNPGLSNPVPTGGGMGGGLGLNAPPSGIGGFNTGVQPSANPAGGGMGITPGGTIDTALGVASMGLDAIAPGAGQAAQVGIKEANRAIQFAGQAAAIGVGGLMETFLPAGSPLAANSWFSKVAGGLAGARPASPNAAGGPNGGKQGQAAPPMGTPASGQGQGPAPGPGVTVNYTNNQATEDRAGADLTSHLTAMGSGVGH
jgi:hypothetical protein